MVSIVHELRKIAANC